MHAELFTKLGLKKILVPQMETDLRGFNKMVTCLCGFIKLLVTLGEENDAKNIDVDFLVAHCKSV